MKKLMLKNPSFEYLEKGFEEWLSVQGYSKSTVYNLPHHVRELLYYLEQKGLTSIQQLELIHFKKYYQQLEQRANDRRDGGISSAHLNKHGQAMKRFVEYLNLTGKMQLGDLKIDTIQVDGRIEWLTVEEIEALFAASFKQNDYNFKEDQETFGARDRAMLAIFYGCGLRRNEGVKLDKADVDFDKNIIHVRSGKGGKERFVPFGGKCRKYLLEYTFDHRPRLIMGNHDALFVGKTGKRLQGQTLNLRLKALQAKSDYADLMDKEIGLHTLRHSIATHLLSAGMQIESIARFLGHDSLESTQIYTHLIDKDQ